jgi:Family of unknown function (DUF6640)
MSSVKLTSSSRSETLMTQPLAGQGGRMLGRSLLTVANVITVVAPVAADWNDSHIFNKRWPGYARFHGVTALAMAVTLSSANIWSVWSGNGDRAMARFFAAAIPVAYWAPWRGPGQAWHIVRKPDHKRPAADMRASPPGPLNATA